VTAFGEVSKKAAAAFLQTIVLVDDRATFSGPQPEAVPEGELSLQPPDEFQTVAEDAIGKVAEKVPPRGLDAGLVTHSFASSGLVCSILRPTAAETLEGEVINAASRADILVLDWQMNDQGALAIRIIRRLIEADEAAGGRLRLIAIYTEQSPLAPILQNVSENYPRLQPIPGSVALSCNNARVIFLTKGSGSAAPGEGDLGVEPQNLPNRLVGEFAKFAGGLLPNATLAAIGGLRQHTHRVLARFDKNLDGPFLTHRALLSSPEDAEQFAANLILAELGAQVPIERIVGEYMGEASIQAYFAYLIGENRHPALMLDAGGTQTQALDAGKACRVVEFGHKAFEGDMASVASQISKKAFPQRLYLLANDNLAASKDDHARFAIRSKLKRDASSVDPENPETHPKLRLGSLLESGGSYWICLTPYCDSARIPPAGGRFLFAEMTVNEDRFELVVPDGDAKVRVVVDRKRTLIVTHMFSPNAAGEIRAEINDGAAIFASTDPVADGSPPLTFRWLGELKSMHAVKFVQGFAANLARVGLDDFEWHRLQAPDDI
jgi:Response receiver domain